MLDNLVALAVAFHLLAALADWYTTKRAVIDDASGKLREGNPVASFFIRRWGETGLLVFVLAPVVALVLLDAPAYPHYAFGGAHAIAAALNWRLIRRRIRK